jgi:hypothetical protein
MEIHCKIRKHLKPQVTPKLINDNIKEMAFSFESFHGILYNFGAINCIHIPIIATKIDPKSYYYQKYLFHIDSKNYRWKMYIFELGLWVGM